jgi:hypothetical protein
VARGFLFGLKTAFLPAVGAVTRALALQALLGIGREVNITAYLCTQAARLQLHGLEIM